jgi:hypothetical protein
MKSLDRVSNILVKEEFTRTITSRIITEDMTDKFKFDTIKGLANNQFRTASK